MAPELVGPELVGKDGMQLLTVLDRLADSLYNLIGFAVQR